jgi:hypothetical protein
LTIPLRIFRQTSFTKPGGRISRHSLTALIGAERRLDDRPAFGPGKSFFLQKM